ncbi:arylsulfatase [Halosquirtibacter xylanolyticus]|uniref:sulfatase family protein n=1 Tax=Halosquirtibacter xylanolyticus TaxID=3374599 RepID=UPI0037482A03|nr:arylsulfatase [Prolixibacteraceae bacterium]
MRILTKLMISAVGTSALVFNAGNTMAKKKQTKDPNIIFILADDLGYGDVSCLNSKSKIQTPNIDKLAKRGVTFTDAHSSSSVCTPSRYSVLTGRYAWKTRLKRGVLNGCDKSLMKKNRMTVAALLKKKGYQTACIGKWHLGMDFATTDGKKINAKNITNIDYTKEIKNGPNMFGFDYYYGISGSMDMAPYLIVENSRFLEKPDTIYRKRCAYGRPGPAIKGRGPEWFLPTFTDKVVSQIQSYQDSSKPFFIYFPLNAPHTPVAPGKKYKGKSRIGDYGDFVMEVDDVIGRVVRTLKEQGILDNTLIILTSDNGPETICYRRYLDTNHNSSGYLKGVKRDLWEGGHRVPFFAQWPHKIKEGIKTDQTICLADFFETAAEIVDVKHDKSQGEDSYSFLPLLQGKNKEVRPYTIHHSARGDFAIRKGPWVFIEKGNGNSNNTKNRGAMDYYKKLGYSIDRLGGYLYNLDKDRREFNDVSESNDKIVNELNELLQNAKKGYEAK